MKRKSRVKPLLKGVFFHLQENLCSSIAVLHSREIRDPEIWTYCTQADSGDCQMSLQCKQIVCGLRNLTPCRARGANAGGSLFPHHVRGTCLSNPPPSADTGNETWIPSALRACVWHEWLKAKKIWLKQLIGSFWLMFCLNNSTCLIRVLPSFVTPQAHLFYVS